jgi:hypothetical protein
MLQNKLYITEFCPDITFGGKARGSTHRVKYPWAQEYPLNRPWHCPQISYLERNGLSETEALAYYKLVHITRIKSVLLPTSEAINCDCKEIN